MNLEIAHLFSQQAVMDRHWTFFLPPELLCRIFYFSLATSPFGVILQDHDGDMTLSLNLSRMTTPFTLGAVCRYWRHIAFQEPHLWNSVYFVANPHKAAIQAMLLRDWLPRAGRLPLSIEVDCSNDEHKKWSSEYAEQALLILRPIYEYGLHCTSFRTRLPPSCLLLPPKELHIPDPRFDNLTTLEVAPFFLAEGVDDEEPEELDVISVFQHSQRLRHLGLWEIRNEQLELPWTNLALITISTQTLSLYDCLVLLRNAPNVQECTFRAVTYPEQAFLDAFNTNIRLPQLHTLLLDFTELEIGFDMFFDHITTPNLKKLEYHSLEGREFPEEEFQLLQQRSSCPLAVLEIKGSAMTAPTIQACLNPFARTLEHLLVKIPSENGEPVISVQPRLNTFFPRMRSATFFAPVSVIQTLFPSLKIQL